jgi:NADH-quinone oxidoreductase subunit E
VSELQRKFPSEIEGILAKYPPDQKRPAVIALLHLAQDAENYISPDAVREIARILDMSATDVSSIVGFYSLFHEEPGGKYHIQVCTDLPCILKGAGEFLNELCNHLGVKPGETTQDGLFTVEEVKCLAACHRAPMFQIQAGGHVQYHEQQTLETVSEMIAEIRSKAAIKGEASG